MAQSAAGRKPRRASSFSVTSTEIMTYGFQPHQSSYLLPAPPIPPNGTITPLAIFCTPGTDFPRLHFIYFVSFCTPCNLVLLFLPAGHPYQASTSPPRSVLRAPAVPSSLKSEGRCSLARWAHPGCPANPAPIRGRLHQVWELLL